MLAVLSSPHWLRYLWSSGGWVGAGMILCSPLWQDEENWADIWDTTSWHMNKGKRATTLTTLPKADQMTCLHYYWPKLGHMQIPQPNIFMGNVATMTDLDQSGSAWILDRIGMKPISVVYGTWGYLTKAGLCQRGWREMDVGWATNSVCCTTST